MDTDDYKMMEQSVRRMRWQLRQHMLRAGYIEGSRSEAYFVGQIRGIERVLELLCPDPHNETKDG